MGLLDIFDSEQGRFGLGLLAAAGPRGDGAGTGQRMQEAMGSVDQYRKFKMLEDIEKARAEESRAQAEQRRAQAQKLQAEQAQQQRIQGAASASYRPPGLAQAMSFGPTQDGGTVPQVRGGFDKNGFIDRVMQTDPLKGLELQKAMQGDSQVNKLDVKDFTPASVQKFTQSGNFGDLERMDKLHFQDTGGGVSGLNPFTGQQVSRTQKTGNPFSDLVLRDESGNMIPNRPLVGVKAGLAASGATRVNNQVSIAGPENEYNKNIGTGLAKEGLALVDLARNAPNAVRSANAIRAALAGGAITGTGADARLAIENAMVTAGLVGEGKAASTQALIAELGKTTLAGIKTSGLGAGQGFTDKDREFLQGAVSGTIASTPANLLRVADITERVASEGHKKGSAVLNRWKQDPALRAVAQDTVIDDLPSASAPKGTQPAMSSLPTPNASNKGRRIRDTATGKTLVSNGMQWKEE